VQVSCFAEDFSHPPAEGRVSAESGQWADFLGPESICLLLAVGEGKDSNQHNMAAATAAASTMSLLPISQLRQQHGAGAMRRRPWVARRRRYVVPVRDSHLIPVSSPVCLGWGRGDEL
jgi:hypothetical protein